MEISDLKIQKNVDIKKGDALIIIDMQYDFIPGGALPVEGGDRIIDKINQIGAFFKDKHNVVVLTQDWHPKSHLSFASNHPDKDPGDEYSERGIGPILWPDHCVQDTQGAAFHEDLDTSLARAIIRKGTNPKVDSYSAFKDNLKEEETGLKGYLRNLGIERIFICGLALDYCVYYTAIDGNDFGFDVNLIIDATKGIDDPEGSVSNALEDMENKGVEFVNSESFNL
jgi:nicotinamidase/pyrazinamidase